MTKLERQIKKMPDTPGVYLFYNSAKELIYAGKATSLRSRVGSYFRDVIFTRQSAGAGNNIDPSSAGERTQDDKLNKRPIEAMIHEVRDIKYRPTDSVLEAIILEGNYIKKFRPRYNIDWRDDKSWNYIALTKDKFPRVIFIREHELLPKSAKKQFNDSTIKHPNNFFGPFPGLNTKVAQKLLRRLFFVSDCRPNQGKPCFYRQLGQCLGVCTGEITAKDYNKKVIVPLKLFLSGKKQSVMRALKKDMALCARRHDFEEAARLRDQLNSLQRIQDIALINRDLVSDVVLRPNGENNALRLEAYDISNLGESDKVGSMVVFDGQGPVKSEYKKFNIKTVVGQSDVDCLAEVLSRRLNHPEWPAPSVVLLDGGKPQINRIQKLFNERKIKIPLVGIAKGPTRRKNEIVFGRVAAQVKHWVYAHIGLVIRSRDEAHRFAIAFNRSKRKIKDRF